MRLPKISWPAIFRHRALPGSGSTVAVTAAVASAIGRHLLVGVLALALSSVSSPGQTTERLTQEASADLAKSLAELSNTRQQIENERLPLAQRLSELEQKLADEKIAFTKAQRFQENQLVELNAIKAEAKRQSDEVNYIASLLSEYARAFRSRLQFVEEPAYEGLFTAVEKAAQAPDLSAADRFNQRSVLLASARQRIETILGGALFDGKALDKQGRLQQGKVALIGPVAMFASSDGSAAGILQQELNRTDPTVFEVDPKLASSSRALVTSGTGELALDATLGNAVKLAALKVSLYEKLAEGGPVMVPILGLGLASLIIGFVKWIQLSRIRSATDRDLQTILRHLNQGDSPAAASHAQSISGPAGDLLATVIAHAGEKKDFIEEIAYEKMLAARIRLERGIPFLALTATTGPLLGLLGTVTGMIATFKLISSFGSGDPKLLAAGISEALMATATGMGVAIPALLLHAFLNRKAKGIIGSMEQTAVGFINGVPEDEKTTFA